MAKVLLVGGKFQSPPVIVNGVPTPNNAGSVLTYEVGTTTPKTTYSDTALSSANANPVVLDSEGRADILYNGDIKIIVRDSDGNTIYTQDGASPQASTATTVLSTNTTLTAAHDDTLIECTAAITVSLTSATTLGNKWSVDIYNSTASTVTVARLNAGDTINGTAANTTIAPYSTSRIYVNNGGTGFILSNTSVNLTGNNTFTGNNIFTGTTTLNGATPLIFEGASDDTYETSIAVTDPTADRTQTLQNQTGTISLADPIVGSSKAFTAKNNATNPNYQVDVSATSIVLHDSSSNALNLQTWSVTVDITASGANGLDTGAEANSTWYYLYAIYDGTNKRGLISASATSPTMPSGYTYKALVGAFYNNSGGNIVAFHQYGKKIFYDTYQAALTAGASQTEAAITITGFVPSIAEDFLIYYEADTSASGSRTATLRVVTGLDFFRCRCVINGGTNVPASSGQVIAPNISQTLYYLWSGANGDLDVSISGYTLP